MKKLFTLFLLAFLPLMASADPVEIDGIYYNLNSSDGINTAEVKRSPNNYSGDIVLPEYVTFEGVVYSVTSISEGAFFYCSGLTYVTIPNSITKIGEGAFRGCSGLTSVTIPNSVTSIGDRAFWDCGSLSSIILPNSVTSIGSYAFYGCSGLTSVTIPNSVTSIGDGAFYECSGLTSITIPNSVTSIGLGAFSGCSGLTSITIPNSVTEIGFLAFQNCSALSSITFPNSIFSIGSDAFSGTAWYDNQPDGIVYAGKVLYNYKGNMQEVTTIDIKDGTLSIANGAFSCGKGPANTYLTSITIPNSVTSIESYAFFGCLGIVDVFCYAEKVPRLGREAFYWEEVDNVYTFHSKITLHVPAGSIEAYKGTYPWNEFKEIVAIEDEEETTEDVIKITSAGQTTWCSAYDLDFSNVEGLKAYTATGYHRTKGTIWLTRVKEVPAGEGILLIGDEGEYKVPHKSTTAYYANLMVGTLKAITINETDGEYTNYYLSNGDSGVGFYKVNGSVDIKANRAYLPLLKNTVSGTRGFIGMDFDDDEDGTTGIEVQSSIFNRQSNDVYYNLQGQRMDNPTKGLYIKNGKKVVVN